MKRVCTVIDRMSGLLRWPAIAAVLTLVITMDVLIFARKVLSLGMVGAYEISQICFLFLGLLAASYVLKEGGHLHVSLVVDMLTPVTRYRLLAAGRFLASLFCMVMVYQSWIFVEHSLMFGELTDELFLPAAAVKAVLLVAFAFLSLQFISEGYKLYQRAKSGDR